MSPGRLFFFGGRQFDRKATIGSIPDAFLAGIYPAIAAIRSALDIALDNIIPKARPNTANVSVRNRMRLCKSMGDAPSAIRIPISCTRWLTEKEMTA